MKEYLEADDWNDDDDEVDTTEHPSDDESCPTAITSDVKIAEDQVIVIQAVNEVPFTLPGAPKT